MAFAFKYFVIFAEMRTGSNFLQSHLNKFPDLHCFGELFNPVFIDRPGQSSALGLSMADRDKNPVSLLREIRKNRTKMQGFRYFHNHDPRILSALFKDPSCAKIILTRNPIDSFVSLKIARETGQWNLFDTRQKKTTKVKFVAEEFETRLSKLQFFQELILQRLQMAGQTGFYLRYDDLNNLSVINGLGNYLGSAHKLKDLSSRYKPQNPTYLHEKVVNPEDMQTALANMDPFKLSSTPSFEPKRAPTLPNSIAAARSPLLYLLIPSGPDLTVENWLASLDRVETAALQKHFSQSSLIDWKRRHATHRSFTVLRHPVARAHSSFCALLTSRGPQRSRVLRHLLDVQYDLHLPEKIAGFDPNLHRHAFEKFIAFLADNLRGQTTLRIDPHWASQTALLRSYSAFCPTDMIIREDELQTLLPFLAQLAGYKNPPTPVLEPEASLAWLTAIYDQNLENHLQDIYQQDYLSFGFGAWSST